MPAASIFRFSVNRSVMFISRPGERVEDMNGGHTFVLVTLCQERSSNIRYG